MGTIQRYFSELLKAYAKKDYLSGLDISRRAHRDCPEDHADTWFWQACMRSLLGDPHAAIQALASGLAEGVWWNPTKIDGDSDLVGARELPEYGDIRAECAMRYREKQSASRPDRLHFTPPAGVDPGKVLLALHWMGGSAREFSPHWEPLAAGGWTLIVPQSSQVLDCRSYCWDDIEKGKDEVRAHIAELPSLLGIRPALPIIAGASQGARLAFEIAREIGAPFLCVIPSFPRDFPASLDGPNDRHLCGAFLLGERDDRNARSRPVIEAVKAGGAWIRERIMTGVGHEFPDDFAEQAAAELEAIQANRPPRGA